MATDILLVRDGDRLAAAEAVSFDVILGMSQGEYVTASVRRARNPKHHRKFFLLLNLVLTNQEKYKTIEQLLNAVKVGIGHCDWGTVWLRGVPVQVAVPKSISFANMGQEKFSKIWELAVEFILTEIIPGLNRDDLERQVLEMVGI